MTQYLKKEQDIHDFVLVECERSLQGLCTGNNGPNAPISNNA